MLVVKAENRKHLVDFHSIPVGLVMRLQCTHTRPQRCALAYAVATLCPSDL